MSEQNTFLELVFIYFEDKIEPYLKRRILKIQEFEKHKIEMTMQLKSYRKLESRKVMNQASEWYTRITQES